MKSARLGGCLAKIWPIPVEAGQSWSIPSHLLQIQVEALKTLVDVGPMVAEFAPNLVELGQGWPSPAQFRPIRWKLPKICSTEFGRNWRGIPPKVGRRRPNLGRARQKFGRAGGDLDAEGIWGKCGSNPRSVPQPHKGGEPVMGWEWPMHGALVQVKLNPRRHGGGGGSEVR